ncbi:MAG TPA: MinD/ParA family protein [Chromatiaceae bacterium]|jgi:flagellar biosynthesis protein FlhG|nr:MinD/ParA family protein [Chromatiaceae bacterium]HIB85099.1 MinD/ParA family protein [Chromatiaceae bacterium]HIN82560.1 MinD/ParA family protein [Chromatiales bacterium]HIO53536.1 MinD/ParA family protein [Chromatiales bacterium]
MLTNSALDQAAGLRQMVSPKPVKVIAVASGKGGVGKSNVSINLATCMAANGHNVMLLDADLGLANIDVLLGLRPIYNLSHVLDGERTLDEILMTGPGGIQVIPASSGMQHMAELSPAEHVGVVRAFSELSYDVDTLIIDTAAGISDSVVTFSRAAQEIVVVVCDEPASITDAYALIKLLNQRYGINRFRVLANMVQSTQEGRNLFAKISKVTDSYLDVMLDFCGIIPFDEFIRKSVRKQRAVSELFPRSRSAQAFKNLARKADNWPLAASAGGHLEFFVERLIQYGVTDQEVVK